MHEYKNNREKKLSLNSYILVLVYVIFLKANFEEPIIQTFKTFLNLSGALQFILLRF